MRKARLNRPLNRATAIHKKIKNFQKPIDKPLLVWYNRVTNEREEKIMPYAYKIYTKENLTFPYVIAYSKKKITNKAEALALLNSQSVVPCKSEDDIACWERTSWICSKLHDWQFKRMLNKF